MGLDLVGPIFDRVDQLKQVVHRRLREDPVAEINDVAWATIGLPQYVTFIPGLATWTLPSPLDWRIFTCGQRSLS